MAENLIATGFNERGLSIISEWISRVAKEPEQIDLTSLFDLPYADFENEINTVIELGSYLTKSGNPETCLVTRSMVEFKEIY